MPLFLESPARARAAECISEVHALGNTDNVLFHTLKSVELCETYMLCRAGGLPALCFSTKEVRFVENWQLLTLEEVEGGDTYELAPASSYDSENVSGDSFWRPEYLYIPDEPWGMGCLAPYLEKVFPAAAYYGEQRIPLADWDRVEALALKEDPGDGRRDFFACIRIWLREENRGEDYFWFLGI